MEVDSSDPHAQLGAEFTSSSYIPADQDTELLQRDELRSVRIGLELLKPELIQREERIRSTIVVFGSARLQEPAADELFETLTLLQTGKTKSVIIVLVGRGFWERVINWQLLVECGLIAQADLNLFHYALQRGRRGKIVGRFEGERYGDQLKIAPRVIVSFHDAGHILGSAAVRVKYTARGNTTTVLFSGDLGRSRMPILRDPEPPPSCDVLILESTYGDRAHEEVGEETKKKAGFARPCSDAQEQNHRTRVCRGSYAGIGR